MIDKFKGMTAEQIARTVTDPMRHALATGKESEGSARLLGHTNTIVALMDRGLVHTDGRWTALGREVARMIIAARSRVKTIDELHEQAAEQYAAERPIRLARAENELRANREIEAARQRLGLSPDLADAAADEPERTTFGITESGRKKIAAAVERNAGAAKPAQRPREHVVSRYGQRGYVVARTADLVTLSVSATPVEVTVETFERDWWPDRQETGAANYGALPTRQIAQASAREVLRHLMTCIRPSQGDLSPDDVAKLIEDTAQRFGVSL